MYSSTTVRFFKFAPGHKNREEKDEPLGKFKKKYHLFSATTPKFDRDKTCTKK